MRRSTLHQCVRAALAAVRVPPAGEASSGRQFIARALGFVRSPLELVSLCDGLSEEDRDDLLALATKSFDLDPSIVAALLDDSDLLERLSPSPLWCSDALWTRATLLFEELPGRRFEIDDLVPRHLPEGVRARAVLGAALDSDRLTPDAVAALRRLYPNDAYIQSRVGA